MSAVRLQPKKTRTNSQNTCRLGTSFTSLTTLAKHVEKKKRGAINTKRKKYKCYRGANIENKLLKYVNVKLQTTVMLLLRSDGHHWDIDNGGCQTFSVLAPMWYCKTESLHCMQI